MGSYYEHRRAESVEIPYSFRCEHCMSDSGPLRATVVGYGTKDSLLNEVSEKAEKKMRKEAHKHLVMVLKRIHKDIVQKQAFTAIFTDECPHCHKPQSWGISILKGNMYSTPVGILLSGVFFVGCSLIGYDFENIPLAVGIAVVGVAAAAISLIWNIHKINAKKKMLATAVQKNLPVIKWEAVQYLLDEQ